MPLKEYPDHNNACTWHDDVTDVRCSAPAVAGSAKRAVCMDHLKKIRKQEWSPEDYAAWVASVES